jgi:hypothetical protein
MSRIRSGENIVGVVVAMLAIAIPLCSSQAADARSVCLAFETSHTQLSESGTICFPVPECESIEASFTADGRPVSMRLVKTAYIRDQRIALFRADEDVSALGEIEVEFEFEGATGPTCTDAGPLTRTCGEVLTGYGGVPLSGPPAGPGTVTRCQTITDCSSAGADILLIMGHAICRSAYVDSLAMHWALTTGLNVAIIDVSRIST